MKKFLFYFSIHFFLISLLHAQNTVSDSLLNKRALDNAIAVYKNSVKANPSLYNGSMYAGYIGKLRSSPFFKYDKYVTGKLVFNQVQYEDVPLLYDIVKDELIIEHFNQVSMVQLESENIASFNFPGSTFIRIVKDSTKRSIPQTGFYELLYDGRTILYAQRRKILKEVGTQGFIEYEIIESNKFYIKKDESYYPVKSKASVLHLFKDKKKALKAYLKSTNTIFLKDRERSIRMLTREYDKLNIQ